MTIKKMLLFASMALAAVAFAAPAAQANPFFYTDPGTVLLPEVEEHGEGTPVTIDGSLQSEGGPGHAFRSGPCEVHGLGEIWNTPTDGEGTITEVTLSNPCPTNVPGCTVAENGVEGEPFLITTGTEKTPNEEIDGTVTIKGVKFFNVYNDGCTGLGIPPGIAIGAEGDLTGTTTTDGCIDFKTSPHLKNAAGASVAVSGEVCITDLGPDGPQGRGSITIH